MRGRHWRTFVLTTASVFALSACGGDEVGDDAELGADAPAVEAETEMAVVDLPEGVTQEQFQQGQQLFTGQGGCHACHGPDATGTQLAPDLTDDEWLNVSGRNFDEIVELIHTGVPQPEVHPAPMPPMGGASLTDEQVEALAAYVVGISAG